MAGLISFWYCHGYSEIASRSKIQVRSPLPVPKTGRCCSQQDDCRFCLPYALAADFANLPYVWHKCKDFVKDGTTISLIYRMATIQART